MSADLPVLVGTAEAGEDHVAKAAGSVQFGLALGTFDGALQPFTEEALKMGRRDRTRADQWRGR